MARYSHLPIYKSVYDLNLYFFSLARGLPKDFRYTLAKDIEDMLLKLIDQIVIANNTNDKTIELKKGLIIIERIKIKARLLHDLKIMKIKSYQCFFEQLVEISKQFEKWLKWSTEH